MKHFALTSLLGWVFVLTLQAAAQELHPALAKGEKPLRQVVLLPPGIAVVKQGIASTALLEQETASLTARLTAALNAAFAAKGIRVLPNPFTPAALEQDQQLQYELADLQARYDLLAPALHQDAKAVRRGEFTLGKEVAQLNRTGQADALVLIRAYGTDPTLAKTAYALLVPFGGTPLSTLYVSIALLDGQNGAVLCLTKQVVTGNFRQGGKAEQKLANAVAKALQKLPPVQ